MPWPGVKTVGGVVWWVTLVAVGVAAAALIGECCRLRKRLSLTPVPIFVPARGVGEVRIAWPEARRQEEEEQDV